MKRGSISGQSDSGSDDGETTEREEMLQEGRRDGEKRDRRSGSPGVSAVCPPAYLWSPKLLDRGGRGREALSGADR